MIPELEPAPAGLSQDEWLSRVNERALAIAEFNAKFHTSTGYEEAARSAQRELRIEYAQKGKA